MEQDLEHFFAALPPWKAAILIVALPTAIAMFGPVLTRRMFGVERLIINNEIAGFKFAVVGVIYGLLLTFAAISTWDKFSEAQVSVIEEAAAATAVYQLTNGSEQDQLAVRMALGKYLRSVIDKEWPAMQAGQQSEEASGALSELYMNAIQLIQKASLAPAQQKATAERQKVAIIPTHNTTMPFALTIELIKQVDAITKSRRTRVHLSAGIVPNMLWDVLITGAALTIIFTCFFGTENLAAQVAMVGVLSAMIFMSILMIISFDLPFTGPVNIGPEALKDLLKSITYR
jgi:hypothetical protein